MVLDRRAITILLRENILNDACQSVTRADNLIESHWYSKSDTTITHLEKRNINRGSAMYFVPYLLLEPHYLTGIIAVIM